MPILIVLLLTAACARVPWPPPPLGLGGSGSLALTAFAFLVPVGATIVLSRWASSALRHDPDHRALIARKYSTYRRLLGYANLATAALAIAGLGWGWTVWNRGIIHMPEPVLAPMAELLVPAPYLLSVFVIWLIHYDAERALYESSHRAEQPFWTRIGHFLFQLRPFAFLVMLPVVLFAAHQTFARVAPEAAMSVPAQIAGMMFMPVLFIGMPLLLKPALGLIPLPDGPLRDHLESISRRLRFRYTNLLHWPTRGQMVNAMVVGIVPRARYVVFTDRLLESLDTEELDAVFGHEVGHVKHGHIPFYVLFFILSAIAITGIVSLTASAAIDSGWIDESLWEPWSGLPPLVVLMVHIFLTFGYLSRQCERQADLFGCRVASHGARLTREGIDAMIRALERVADLSGEGHADPRHRRTLPQRFWALFRSWQHGSIHERILYLRRVQVDPQLEPRFQWRIFFLKWAVVLTLLGIIVGIGSYFGWKEIARAI